MCLGSWSCARGLWGWWSGRRKAVRPRPALVHEPQPLEREVGHVLVDRLAVRGDQPGEPAGHEHAGAAAELALHAPHDAVHLAGEAVDDAALERVHGVAPDHGRRRDELDAREPRRAVEERLHRDRDARARARRRRTRRARRRRRSSSRCRSRRRCTAPPAARERGDGVDDAVGADLARVVHQDRDAAAHAGADQQRVDPERALAHPGPLDREHRHGRGDDERGHLARVEIAQREQAVELHGEVVGRAQRARGDAPGVRELGAAPEAQVRLRVADVDGEQHRRLVH